MSKIVRFLENFMEYFLDNYNLFASVAFFYLFVVCSDYFLLIKTVLIVAGFYFFGKFVEHKRWTDGFY